MKEYESKYESRFYYILDDSLRIHMADALEFISDLISISDNFPKQKRNYFRKTCILYTASLIESHLNYYIISSGHTHHQSNDRQYSNVKESKINDENWDQINIITCKRTKKQIPFDWQVDLNLLIDYSEKIELYDNDFWKELHKVRKMRNQIHLMKLQDIDRKCWMKKLNDTFSTSRKLFKMVEKELIK